MIDRNGQDSKLDRESADRNQKLSVKNTSKFFELWRKRYRANSGVEDRITELDRTISTEKRLFQGIRGFKKSSRIDKDISVLEPTIPRDVLLKSLPILIVSSFLLFISLYFVSPYSKMKQIKVNGNQRLTGKQIEEFSLISDKDYVVTTLLHAGSYANNIVNSSPTIKSAEITFSFPNQFLVKVEEFSIIGYVEENQKYFAVLESGEMESQEIGSDALPPSFPLFKLSDRELIKKLAVQLAKVDISVRQKVSTVELTPSKATSDLLTLKMTDENTVLVPLSELGEKLPYYEKIALETTVPTTIDMEVGVYRYATGN
ncbi:FtsQ-type POTRA domain-containing protein [Streptococcus suis]|nr:FtsQ-type POTRA domain-containing protein [Streptococcus suis]NQJ76589.1 FtsQ-type POTRA domain-containing protein [Streptococcus suis]